MTRFNFTSYLSTLVAINCIFCVNTKGKNRALALLLCMICSCIAVAQHITGKVTDESQQSMEFVNVVLLNCGDSAFIAGTVTNTDGGFVLENTDAKARWVKLTSVGYVTKVIEIPRGGNLGVIAMTPDNIMLGEVVVKSNRPVIVIKGNALVTMVDNSVLAHAGTASDVLTQVPTVLGRDGNFEVFGKGTPLIYVNGRKLQNMTELGDIKSSDIKSVEVITNPGVKYDATAKSVIRIRMKRPTGDGWSGSLRTQNGFQHYFATRNLAGVKYRTRELEIFGNLGYLNGRFQNYTSNEMLTLSNRPINQQIVSRGRMHNSEMYGKVGFSYLFGKDQSIGGRYSNGFSKVKEDAGYNSTINIDGNLEDEMTALSTQKRRGYPKHYTNLYYNGMIGKLGIDLNVDYMWNKNRTDMLNNENGTTSGRTVVNSVSTNHGQMFAQKLTLSYPVWKGEIQAGEEYTSSRFRNAYSTDAILLTDAILQVDEKNISGFMQLTQTFGKVELAAGLRYEHIDFGYIADGQRQSDQDKTYNNLFPSLSVSTIIKNAQLSLSYTNKTKRPNYEDIDGTIDYINRFTLESGNKYLKPEHIHAIDLVGAWKQYFIQASFTYRKDPILITTVPYDATGEVKLITKDNLSGIKKLEIFVGSQQKWGIWEPKFNIGLQKQWFTVNYADSRQNLNKPIALVQWLNAIHLPGDVWMNIDMQWMSRGNEDNMQTKSTSYVNAKLYKAFCNNQLSVSLEVNNIFNKSGRKLTVYNKDVTLYQINKAENRIVWMTLQYNFNTTRDRYRGSGSGQSERERF